MDIQEFKEKEGLPNATLTHSIVKSIVQLHKLLNIPPDEQREYQFKIYNTVSFSRKSISLSWQEADILDRCGVKLFTHEGHGYVKFKVRFDDLKDLNVTLFEEYMDAYKEAEIELIRQKNKIENEYTKRFNERNR